MWRFSVSKHLPVKRLGFRELPALMMLLGGLKNCGNVRAGRVHEQVSWT